MLTLLILNMLLKDIVETVNEYSQNFKLNDSYIWD